jgi:hypothetical protein
MRNCEPSNKLPVRESPGLADRSGRRPNTVSATVTLDPHAMARIKEVCCAENRRISDVICEAIDSYLRERTRLEFERSTAPESCGESRLRATSVAEKSRRHELFGLFGPAPIR